MRIERDRFFAELASGDAATIWLMPTDSTSSPVECLLLAELSDDDALVVGRLIAETWPKPGKDAAFRARQLQDLGRAHDGPPEVAPRTFVIRDGSATGGEAIANAVMEPRIIGTAAGDITIMGLGKVCSHPERRGEGLGARVVRAAFGMIDDGAAPFSLFQTSHEVRPFYERIGCCLVENSVYDSTADDPKSNPFWDNVVMRYPAKEGWPTGAIDLRGPGY